MDALTVKHRRQSYSSMKLSKRVWLVISKLVWNDWFKDQGYGVDADKAEALRMLRFLTSEYVSEKAPDLIKAFEGSSSSSFDVKGLRISYRYTRGSAIDERVMVIAPAQ